MSSILRATTISSIFILKYHKMQIDMDSDIVYFLDYESLSYFEYKAGDYTPDDE
jgi:hypothetical protein